MVNRTIIIIITDLFALMVAKNEDCNLILILSDVLGPSDNDNHRCGSSYKNVVYASGVQT